MEPARNRLRSQLKRRKLVFPKWGDVLLLALPAATIVPMDATSPLAARRTEDIALDLLKFVAAHANLSKSSGSATGFGVPSSAKPEDQVTQLLELYSRCRQAVEDPGE